MADEIVSRFNETHLKERGNDYQTRYQGKYLYLDRKEPSGISPVCRLKYAGKMDNWDFAVYKFSSDRYDADEFFFPGMGCVDGTIEGAMKAGLEAYPVSGQNVSDFIGKGLGHLKRLFGLF